MRKLNRRGRGARLCPPWLLIAAATLWLAAPAAIGEEASEALDPSFGEGGIALVAPNGRSAGEAAMGLAEGKGGRLIVAGTSEAERILVRGLLRNGAVDRSFGGEGWVEANAGEKGTAAEAVPGGDLLIAGGNESGLTLLRYRADGSRVKGFGNDGHVVVPGGFERARNLAVAVRSGGRILSAGYKVGLLGQWAGLVIGYRPDGSLDRSFGDGGVVEFPGRGHSRVVISGLAVLPSGRILVGGDRSGRVLLARLLPNGELDRGFGGGDGLVALDVDGNRHCACSRVGSMTLTPSGKPLLAGAAIARGGMSSLLVRFLPSGRLDPRFGQRGVVRNRTGTSLAFNAVTVGRDGAITAAGFYTPKHGGRQATVLRYLADGHLDQGFARSGVFRLHLGRESVASAVLTDSDGRVVVAGHAKLGEVFSEAPTFLEGARILLMRFGH